MLGIDPGTRITGWGVVERVDDARGGSPFLLGGGTLRLVAYGVLKPPADAPIAARLARIHQGVRAVLEEHAPDAVGVEEAFGGKNIRSAIRLGEARAVCMLAAALAGRDVHEVPPALVKKAVAGHGGAGKDTVREAVARLLGLAPDAPLPTYDASDALAVAVCALTRLDAPQGLELGPVGRRRKRARWTLDDVERLGGA